MKKNTCRRLCAVLLILMLVAFIMPTTVYAAQNPTTATFNPDTQSVTIEMPEDWALLVDGSGSMRELDAEVWDELAYWGFTLKSFAFKARFDTELHPDQMDLITRKDTDIVGAIEKVVKKGYNRVVVITDGHQDPGVYDALTPKTGVDIHLMLVGDLEAEPDELIEKITEKLGEGCSLTWYQDHQSCPLKEEYVTPTITIPCESTAESVEKEIQVLQDQVQALTEKIEGAQAKNQAEMEGIESQLVVIQNQHADHWGICFGEHNPACFVGWLVVGCVVGLFILGCFFILL